MALRLLLIRISQHFGTSMPQGGHPPHHSITSSARVALTSSFRDNNLPPRARSPPQSHRAARPAHQGFADQQDGRPLLLGNQFP
jgi:hypothetical protein